MQSDNVTNPSDQGFNTYMDGNGIAHNPYKEGSHAYHAWRAGWQRAQTESWEAICQQS